MVDVEERGVAGFAAVGNEAWAVLLRLYLTERKSHVSPSRRHRKQDLEWPSGISHLDLRLRHFSQDSCARRLLERGGDKGSLTGRKEIRAGPLDWLFSSLIADPAMLDLDLSTVKTGVVQSQA